MSDFTDECETQIADALFGDSDFTALSDLYVAAHAGDPGNDGTSNEVDASEYDRVSTSPGDWSLSGNGPRTATNDTDVEFPEADSDWGTITHLTVWDTSDDSGNAFTKYSLDSDVSIDDGDILRFPSGDIEFDID